MEDYMGLTTWQDAPDGKIEKSDVTTEFEKYMLEFGNEEILD